MEPFDCSAVILAPRKMKASFSSVTTERGTQSVTMTGIALTEMWPADSLAWARPVSAALKAN